jgi:tetratricopeptide (TPR) repeat protein
MIMRAMVFAIVVFATLLTITAQEGTAQERNQHRHEPQEKASTKLGRVNFRTSCSNKVQPQFNQAVAWLHSFEYEEAEKIFTQVSTIDPRCGMAYWGIAMSNFHPLWMPPTPAELKKGSDAAAQATRIGAATQRERDYIAAISTFYKDAGQVDHRTRTFAYSDAMKKLYETNRTDDEAAVFYALALITTGTMTPDKTYAKEKEAAEILNRILARQPRHPGVAHYLIHGYDFPALAHLALPAARSYAAIAPASAHAQHMPSHIFIRLGLWQQAVDSNLDAEAAAKAFALRHHMPGAWDEQLHAMDYLAYAYLQLAQDKKALGVLQDMNKLLQVDPPTFKVAYALSAIPARYALERRQWSEAVKLPLDHPRMNAFPWAKFPWATAHIHFARAIGAGRLGDVDSARKAVNELSSIHNSLSEVRGDYDWARQVDIERQVASAWVKYAEGAHEEALRLMRAAADLDDVTEKHPVTPGAVLPAREQLGELLLELKQPAPALEAFETALRTTPNRFNAVYGAARAATLSNKRQKAVDYYQKLVALSRSADSSRREVKEAKEFLAQAGAAR